MPADYLVPGAAHMDIAGPLAHFAEHGYARLGRVLSDAGAKALGERADALMMGERILSWPLLPERYGDRELRRPCVQEGI